MRLMQVLQEDSINVDGLPPEVIKAFTDLANQQRGAPEHSMLKVTQFYAGVLSPVVEHAGDLIHRMTKDIKYGSNGRQYVENKCKTVYNALTYPYGFEKEINENIQSNAKANNMDVDRYRERLYHLLDQYAEAHKQLPTYNRPQYIANAIAVSLGEQEWNQAAAMTRTLLRLANDTEKWNQQVVDYRMENGRLLLYPDDWRYE